jgi:hypothetical protein
MAFVLSRRADRLQELGRVLIILAVIVGLVILMTAVFGVHLAAADYRIAPDPAGNLPF